jgi:PBP4 family serine-type D-alanyl-D-alanine carboxypeptidase
MSGRKILSVLLALVVAFGTVFPSVEAKRDDLLDRSLYRLVEGLKQDPATRGMVVGYEAVSLDRGEVMASLRAEKTFVPGSVLQLLTGAAVLDAMPEGMRIPTEVYVDGVLASGGTLKGDIILKGYGDPSLNRQRLGDLAEALRKKGIRRVRGDLVVDDAVFDDERLGTGWMWDDEPFPFSAQIGALSVDGNTVTVRATPGALGKPPRIRVSPVPEYVRVVNRAKTVAGGGQALTIDRKRATNELIISGTIGRNHPGVSVRRTVEDPARFAGAVFRELLKREGVKLDPKSRIVSGEVGPGARRIGRTLSPELDELLGRMFRERDPFYAEMLLKQLGVYVSGEGTFEAGIGAVEDFSRRIGMDPGFAQVDGSGLSRMNAIAPTHLVQLLRGMEEHPEKARFDELLSAAGIPHPAGDQGTRSRKGGLRILRGEMDGVAGMAGTVVTREGERMAVAVLVNGVNDLSAARGLLDQIRDVLAAYPDLPDPGEGPEEATYLLSEALDPILEEEPYRGVIAGILVQSLDRDETLYAREAEALLTPASNTKLLTAAAALQALGEDYRFRTAIYRSGALRRGELAGDVILKGYGDPTLATEDSLRVQEGPTVEGIARDLKAMGIRRVQGDIVVDAGAFAGDPYGAGWAWDDESGYYQPQIAALAVNRGTVRLDYLPGEEPGDPIQLRLTPETEYVEVINEAVTGPADSDDTLRIRRERGTNRIRVTGSLPLDFGGDYSRIPVEEPSLYTGQVLKEALEREGITFSPGSRVRAGKKPVGAKRMGTYRSPPLSEVIHYMNKASDNFYAEMVLRTLALEKSGTGTAEGGVEAVMEYARRSGIDRHFRLRDGSGLTRYNRISPAQIVALLTAVAEQPIEETFVESLPVAGVDGTLRNRMRDTDAADNLRGKTGSMTHVSALAGYVRTRDGEELAYAILLNGFSEGSFKDLEDRIGTRLAEFSRKEREEAE